MRFRVNEIRWWTPETQTMTSSIFDLSRHTFALHRQARSPGFVARQIRWSWNISTLTWHSRDDSQSAFNSVVTEWHMLRNSQSAFNRPTVPCSSVPDLSRDRTRATKMKTEGKRSFLPMWTGPHHVPISHTGSLSIQREALPEHEPIQVPGGYVRKQLACFMRMLASFFSWNSVAVAAPLMGLECVLQQKKKTRRAYA